MAESPEVELTTYTHANQLYTIGYPADWTVLDKASIESMSNAVAEGQIDGLSNEQVQAYAQQITSADMTNFHRSGRQQCQRCRSGAGYGYELRTCWSAWSLLPLFPNMKACLKVVP